MDRGTGVGLFDVNPTTGQIRVANGPILDFETPPTSYTLNIDVADTGKPDKDDAVITINVTNVNEAPVIDLPSQS